VTSHPLVSPPEPLSPYPLPRYPLRVLVPSALVLLVPFASLALFVLEILLLSVPAYPIPGRPNPHCWFLSAS
jgi:hypothetical protein